MLGPENSGTMNPGVHPPHPRHQPPATPAISRDAAATADVGAVRKDGEPRASYARVPRRRLHCSSLEPVPPLPRQTRSLPCCEMILECLRVALGQTPAHASGKQSPPPIARRLRNSAECLALSQSTP